MRSLRDNDHYILINQIIMNLSHQEKTRRRRRKKERKKERKKKGYH